MPGRPVPLKPAPFVVADVNPMNWIFGVPLQHASGRIVAQPGGSGDVLLVDVVTRPSGRRCVVAKLEFDECVHAVHEYWIDSRPYAIALSNVTSPLISTLGSIHAPVDGTVVG